MNIFVIFVILKGFLMKIKLGKNAKLPMSSPGNACVDLFYNGEDTVIKSGQRMTLTTGISVEMPDDIVGLIWSRSGLAAKKGVCILGGVIDPSYRGEIMVCILNTSDNDLEIKHHDRIAQMIFQNFWIPNFEICDELSYTERGENGFGSSGR